VERQRRAGGAMPWSAIGGWMLRLAESGMECEGTSMTGSARSSWMDGGARAGARAGSSLLHVLREELGLTRR